ncbi:MAG: ABC-2 type transport system permease protein [Planctomycetota bacterium]|jgi:ABC-2 type transport system permease protein
MFFRAVTYYARSTARNKMLASLRRLRQPKYLIGVIAIGFYIWLFLFRNDAVDKVLGGGEKRQIASTVLTLAMLAQLLPGWITGGRGLLFNEADVQFLFPRPLSRFQLLMFKLFLSQTGVLFTSLFFAMIFAGEDTPSFVRFAGGFWLLQTTVTTHLLLFGLVRGRITSLLRYLPGIALLCVFLMCVISAWLQTGGILSLSDALAFTQTAPLSTLLVPFNAITAPAVSNTREAFVLGSIIPLVSIIGHLIIIRFANLPFEERAIEVASKIKNVRKNGLRGLRSKKKLVLAKPGSPWSLAELGPVWKALVWKNVISITRLSGMAMLGIVAGFVLLAYLVNSTAGDLLDGVGATRVGFIMLAIVAYISFLGPALIRVDLRIDIPHFDVLKSMPIRARSLIFGEIMGTVTILWALQIVVCVVAAVFIVEEDNQVFAWSLKAPILAAGLIGLLAFNFILLTMENLTALWMPGFVRLGRGVKPSLDQMGPYILGALMKLTAMLVLSIPAGLVGTAVGFGGHWLGLSKLLTICLGTITGAVILCWAGLVVIHLSENRYHRFDISSERTTAE